MEEKKFQKKVENFSCKNCKNFVVGKGYTNHCPKCLWSRHVDINPGDRKEKCKGMMKPIYFEVKKDGYVIFYKCLKCNYKHKVKSSLEDNFEEILNLSKNL